MKNTYLHIINCIDRMHHIFLDVLKRDLDSMQIFDINNIQAMIIYNIANQQISVGELISRGMYNGSNVSYNIKKLVQAEYLIQTQSKHDKRSLYLKLSSKGLEVYKKIDACLERHANKLGVVFQNKKYLETVYKGLKGVESFWNQNGFWV